MLKSCRRRSEKRMLQGRTVTARREHAGQRNSQPRRFFLLELPEDIAADFGLCEEPVAVRCQSVAR
jgi:hypothetical protein